VTRPDAAAPVAEVVFAHQSDGPGAGRAAAHIRMPDCGVPRGESCAWCCAPGPSDFAVFSRTPGEIAGLALAGGLGEVVITGHEPHHRAPRFADLVSTLTAAGARVQLHTSGEHDQQAHPNVDANVDLYVVTPRLHHAPPLGVLRHHGALGVLAQHACFGRAVFLLTVEGPNELPYVDALIEAYRVPSTAVWIAALPAAPNLLARRLAALAAPVMERGWNLSPSLHHLTRPVTREGRPR
jgi:organic radical activating enzyme